jgi:transcriptional regulator with XRE-family HTH domain
MTESTGSAVTLEAFSERVDCHFTTASRLRSGDRLPGRKLLGRITKEYHLDPREVLTAYSDSQEEFGRYLRVHVFKTPTEEDLEALGLNRPEGASE